MVILLKHSSRFYRPKYQPHRITKEWVVWNTENKQRLYGPDTRAACERWENCLGEHCASYDPNRDVDKFFGEIRRDDDE